MADNALAAYLDAINKAHLRGDDTEHTHRPALKELIESFGKKLTATNEPSRIACGAPDIVVSRRVKQLEQSIGYIETKDIGINLNEAAKSEQIKKRYLPSLHNFIFTDYIEFRWYVNSEIKMTARLAEEKADGKFTATDKSIGDVQELIGLFLQQEPEKITSAKELAAKMAGLARLLRDITKQTFAVEGQRGALHGQFEAFQKVLLHDLTTEQFADMYAQTIAYGLFAARCHIDDITVFGKDKYATFHGMDDRSKELSRKEAAYLLPKTNPFLRKTFNHIAGPDLDERVAWVVDDLVALLREARMDLILRDFGKRTQRTDPVIHFYETFLAAYDPKLRETRGVYYTPEPVVSYIVRSVDILLKEKFGLKQGLADNSKTRLDSCLRGNDKEGGSRAAPTTHKKEQTRECHRCLILDPAAGTGTFLYQVIEQIYRKVSRSSKGAWSEYVREHLLPRVFGFELMMAPYAVAHMKLGLQLAETGYDFESEERLRIYLTNTLQEAEEISNLALLGEWLAEEAREANDVKRELPIMVVLGNPPYSGVSANQGKWINGLIDTYREVDGQPLEEKKVWLKNDYIKFIRFGQWRIEQTGSGILAFITDHSYLDSPTFRGMRQNLLKTFNEIYLLNLHGNSKRKETSPDGSKDDNVFDITQGTVISLFVKYPNVQTHSVYYADLWGKREEKYDALLKADIKKTAWVGLEPSSPFYAFVPVNKGEKSEYDKGWKITEVFPLGSNGVQTSRDDLVVSACQKELLMRFEKFRNREISDSQIKNEFNIADHSFWSFEEARKDLLTDNNWKAKIKQYLYRPFDEAWLFASKAFVHRLRLDVMQHLMKLNHAICVGRAGLVQSGDWDLVFCTQQVCDHNLFYRGSSMNFPLYLYCNSEKKDLFEQSKWPVSKNGRVPNLSREFVEAFSQEVEFTFVSEGEGDFKKTFGPEDVFHYIYAVFHSPTYRAKYAEFLKIDFPRVPMPKSKELFIELCGVGKKLCKLHLMESEILEDEKRWPKFAEAGEGVVEAGYPKYVCKAEEADKGRVYINKDQYFEGVRQEVWEFCIGGYQVCEKWLKDRRGRKLTYEDIQHYQKIAAAIGETIMLMRESCLEKI